MTPSDIVTYIKAGNQLSVSEVMVLADVIEQQAATIARLSAPCDNSEAERLRSAQFVPTLREYRRGPFAINFNSIIEERLNG